MKAVVQSCAVPQPSIIATRLDGATFYDSYATPLRDEDFQASAADLALRVFLKVPAWIEFLMRMRNRIVGLVGLKNQGSFTQGVDAHKTAASYGVGDRLGIFTVMHVSADEFIMGDDDKHLKVQISVCKTQLNGAPHLAVSTVVNEHNWLGKVYMFFVGPAHKVIAPATLRYGYA
jgi:Protein of unknown function (DUF2867)